MRIQSVTVGLPCTDLTRSVEWYRCAFELDTPDLEPSDGVVEFKLGPVWVQLAESSDGAPSALATLRIEVPDVASERSRLVALGVTVGPLAQVDNVGEYVDFADPDGNRLALFTEVEP
ncbi:MAG: VOC family protein [Propionicimonas sp.]|uniref:VOC family protein n=1 Tax=Propionicimonas sp. TaxID=1955623 RepID=UPI003D0D0989